jgi:3-dehydroquinate synthase
VSEPLRIDLTHPGGTTPIFVGSGALAQCASRLTDWWQGRTLFLVSSQTVAELHMARVAALAFTARKLIKLVVPDGEQAKSLQQAAGLWREMIETGGKRDSRLLALGGGSVGDLAGFVAGTFLRGIQYLQVPTTLLAQVDAAIGGKTAIDLPQAKNSVGLFHHPHAVVADIDLLQTLPPGELRAGLFEVVKAGAVLSSELFERLEGTLDAVLRYDTEELSTVVAAAVEAKVRLVERDPEERDQRRLLNFGHTLAHAIETVQGYSGLRHGEAVGYGMLFALRLACARGLATDTARRVHALILRLGLPELRPVEPGALLLAMARDKKVRESGLVWVLPTALGRGEMVGRIPALEVERALERFLADPLVAP